MLKQVNEFFWPRPQKTIRFFCRLVQNVSEVWPSIKFCVGVPNPSSRVLKENVLKAKQHYAIQTIYRC